MHKMTIQTFVQWRVMSFSTRMLKDSFFMNESPDDFLGNREEPDIYSDNVFLCLKIPLKSARFKRVYNPNKTAASFRCSMSSRCNVSWFYEKIFWDRTVLCQKLAWKRTFSAVSLFICKMLTVNSATLDNVSLFVKVLNETVKLNFHILQSP